MRAFIVDCRFWVMSYSECLDFFACVPHARGGAETEPLLELWGRSFPEQSEGVSVLLYR